MNLEKIQNEKVEVRILDSTYSKQEEAKEMIGGVYEVISINYDLKIVNVRNKDKSNYWYFIFSDVQILTPISFEGRRIGIGDMVKRCDNWGEVYSYYLHDGRYYLNIATDKDYNNCWSILEREIEAVKPLQQDDIEVTIKENGKSRNIKISQKSLEALLGKD